MAEEFKSLKGHLLLDGGKLRGSFFHRTVVLICQHDAEGAMGLVLNRASGKNVGEMIVADMADSLKKQPLFLGGPVQPQALSFLHTDEFLFNANVLPSLNLGHSLDDLVELGESFSTTQQVRAIWDELRAREIVVHRDPTIDSEEGWAQSLLAGGADVAELVELILIRGARPLPRLELQQLREAEHRVQRRAQLVAHARQEL